MRAVVFAYHNMGIVGLKALLKNEFSIAAVFTHDDNPTEHRWFSSVKEWAEMRGIPVYSPPDINDPTWVNKIAEMNPQCLFSFYYRQILSESILDIAPAKAYNLHGSLLPAYRGRVPVNWALVNGEKVTGVTLHRMVKKADAGDIVGQKRVEVDFYDTARTLFDKLCQAAEELLDEVLPLIRAGVAPSIPQDEARATTFPGRKPEDGKINWQKSAYEVYNLVRAVTRPYPGAFSYLLDGQKLMVWWCLPDERFSFPESEAGDVILHDGVAYVKAGRGIVRLIEIELESRIIKGKEIYQYFKEKGRVKLA